MSDHPTPSVCPRCAVGCRLVPGEEGRARGAVGPANPNGRLCRKGVGAYQVGSEDRLTEPLVRRDGEFEAVSWTTAYERVVDGLQDVLAAHGPEALAFLGAPHCTNEENYLLQKLARTLGTNNVDNRARLCHVSSTRALADRVGWPATTSSLSHLAAADVILVAGANPAERQPIAFNSFVRPAVTSGATLVHIDPVGNRTTRLADCHVAPRPGTDGVVFDLLSGLVAETGDGVDHGFIEERTRGYDGFAAGIAELDHEQAISTAGVDRETIAHVAELVTEADRVAALVGTGIEGDEDDPNAADSLLDLLLLTGNLGRRGTGCYVLRGLVNEQGATDAGCVPDRLPGHQPVTDADARSKVAAEWGVEPPSTPGQNANELLAAFGDDVRGAVVVGENPAVSKRDAEWIRRRLDSLDPLVVLDIVPTQTTRHADVVLPVAAGVEKEGTFTNLERRVQRSRPTRTPPKTVRSDFAVLCELGSRLTEARGLFDYSGVEALFEELTRVAPTHTGLSYDGFEQHGCQWPTDSDGVLYGESFDTRDGLAAFGTPQSVVDTGNEVADSNDEQRLRLVTGGRASEFDADHAAAERRLRIHPADASDRGIEAAESVVVSDGQVSVETSAETTDRIRAGTVYLPAETADPLLRAGAATVVVRPASEPTADAN